MTTQNTADTPASKQAKLSVPAPTHEPAPVGALVPTGEPIPMGLVFDIQRFSLYDGPGIRTTVFLKGCPLHCPWCHNPESVAPKAELLFNPDQCVHCGACVAVCPTGAHRTAPTGEPAGAAVSGPCGTSVGRLLDRRACVVCGACAQVCPSDALAMCGQKHTVRDVMRVVSRDRGYYADSGGGLTVSGGEPLLQPTFTLALLTAAKEAGLHTTVETSGYTAWHHLETIRPTTDLFLFDIKETDPQRHKQVTGVPVHPIHENLRRLAETGARIILRLPFIPGYNDRPDHIEAIAQLAHNLPTLAGVDLLPYHRLGKGKRALLGQDDREVSHPPEPAQVQVWQARFAAAGLVIRVPGES
jgi:glycyl-radical enzyme activating protein